MGIVCMERKKMNKELAIRILRGEVLGTNEQTDEAIDMAIKALKEQPAIYCKDCNFCGEIDENEWHCCENLDEPRCKFTSYKFGLDDYCSRGERREE